MELVKKKLSEITPYPNNPRVNEQAVDDVAKSIEQCGYVAPIIVDEDGVILAGHTRIKALEKLGRTECEVIVYPGLTEEQKRKYRVLDNATAEESTWDFDLLEEEIQDLDFSDFDIDLYGADESYFDTIENEPYVGSGEAAQENFAITFLFPIERKEQIDAFIKEHGRAYVTDLIIREADKNA